MKLVIGTLPVGSHTTDERLLEQLEELSEATHKLVDKQYSTLLRSLMPLMEQEGIHLILQHEDLNKEQKKYVDEYFMMNV